MPMTFGRCKTFLMLLAASYCHGYTAPASTAFATFGNAAARDLIKGWMPKPLAISSKNQGMLPTSQENMKRVIRARILLEDANTGCVACSEDALCVILCRFSKAEHQLILPLWNPEVERPKTFGKLIAWHQERFNLPGEQAPRLSGAALEWEDDRKAWAEGLDEFSA